jgi:hypothetical protein
MIGLICGLLYGGDESLDDIVTGNYLNIIQLLMQGIVLSSQVYEI